MKLSVSPDPQTEVETQFWMQVAYSGSEPGGWGGGQEARRSGDCNRKGEKSNPRLSY